MRITTIALAAFLALAPALRAQAPELKRALLAEALKLDEADRAAAAQLIASGAMARLIRAADAHRIRDNDERRMAAILFYEAECKEDGVKNYCGLLESTYGPDSDNWRFRRPRAEQERMAWGDYHWYTTIYVARKDGKLTASRLDRPPAQ